MCATCHNNTCRIQEVRKSLSQQIRVVIFSIAQQCVNYTERSLHPEDQEVHIPALPGVSRFKNRDL